MLIKIISPIHFSWVGGSKFALRENFHKFCITRNDYLEHGPKVCLNKFVN